MTALSRRSDNEAESERRRDFALRAVAAHIATVDRIESAAQQATSARSRPTSATRSRGSNAATATRATRLNAAPFEVAQLSARRAFARTPSVVLTSATLAEGRSFAFLREMLGIDDAQELIAPSPFDYARPSPALSSRRRTSTRRTAISPSAPRRSSKSVSTAPRGRAFVLFTSYARLREVYALLAERLTFPTRCRAICRARRCSTGSARRQNAVLFGTGTFWEGIDVVGDQLSCVIIDRLPFPSPADPLVAARIAALEARGVRASSLHDPQRDRAA